MNQTNHTMLISGASGFIGRYIVEYSKLNNIEVLVVPPIDLGTSLFNDFIEQAVKDKGAESLSFVLASWASTANNSYRSNLGNLEWPILIKFVTKTLENFSIPFIGLGSCMELSTDFEDNYTKSKRMARDTLETSMENGSWAWLRLYYVFSAIEKRPNLVNSAIEAINDGSPIELWNSKKAHDFIAVEDVATAVCTVILNNIRGDVDVGSGFLSSVENFISAIFPKVKIVESTKSMGNDRSSYSLPANIELLKKFGWGPNRTNEIILDTK